MNKAVSTENVASSSPTVLTVTRRNRPHSP